MDAILPLIRRDLERFRLLWQSLETFVSGLETLWIVVPDADRDFFSETLPRQGVSGCVVRVESELEFLPTLRWFPKTHGWYRQMLVKYQAAQRVKSDYYLTLDADVVATRRVNLKALCYAGKAACHVDHADLHPKWYAAAASLLDADLPRTSISHGVTPALLHAPSMRQLLERLSLRWESGDYCSGLRGLKQRFGVAQTWWKKVNGSARALGELEPWCAFLCGSRPWAEYALYFSFLELTGDFSRHFVEVYDGVYSTQGSVWAAESFESWDPAPLFQGSGAPYFAVIQSNSQLSIESIRARVEPFFSVAVATGEPG